MLKLFLIAAGWIQLHAAFPQPADHLERFIKDPPNPFESIKALRTRIDEVRLVNQGALFYLGGAQTQPRIGLALEDNSLIIYRVLVDDLSEVGSIPLQNHPLDVASEPAEEIFCLEFVEGQFRLSLHPTRMSMAFHFDVTTNGRILQLRLLQKPKGIVVATWNAGPQTLLREQENEWVEQPSTGFMQRFGLSPKIFHYQTTKVQVPQNHFLEKKGEMELNVLRFGHRKQAAATAIWMLPGGPGIPSSDVHNLIQYVSIGMLETAFSERQGEHNLDVYLMDHRGTGSSAFLSAQALFHDPTLDPQTFAVSQAAHDLAWLIQKFNRGQNVYVFGWSYGTYLVERFLSVSAYAALIQGAILDGVVPQQETFLVQMERINTAAIEYLTARTLPSDPARTLLAAAAHVQPKFHQLMNTVRYSRWTAETNECSEWPCFLNWLMNDHLEVVPRMIENLYRGHLDAVRDELERLVPPSHLRALRENEEDDEGA